MPVDGAMGAAYELIRHAERVLVGAGSGLSVDAGIDYTDKGAFAKRFPAMVKRGFSMKAELIGYTGWTPAVMWGYLATHVDAASISLQPLPPAPAARSWT